MTIDFDQAGRQNFAMLLLSQATTHEEWLKIVRFGLGSLLKDQTLLLKVLHNEVGRQESRGAYPRNLIGFLEELKLKIVLND